MVERNSHRDSSRRFNANKRFFEGIVRRSDANVKSSKGRNASGAKESIESGTSLVGEITTGAASNSRSLQSRVAHLSHLLSPRSPDKTRQVIFFANDELPCGPNLADDISTAAASSEQSLSSKNDVSGTISIKQSAGDDDQPADAIDSVSETENFDGARCISWVQVSKSQESYIGHPVSGGASVLDYDSVIDASDGEWGVPAQQQDDDFDAHGSFSFGDNYSSRFSFEESELPARLSTHVSQTEQIIHGKSSFTGPVSSHDTYIADCGESIDELSCQSRAGKQKEPTAFHHLLDVRGSFLPQDMKSELIKAPSVATTRSGSPKGLPIYEGDDSQTTCSPSPCKATPEMDTEPTISNSHTARALSPMPRLEESSLSPGAVSSRAPSVTRAEELSKARRSLLGRSKHRARKEHGIEPTKPHSSLTVDPPNKKVPGGQCQAKSQSANALVAPEAIVVQALWRKYVARKQWSKTVAGAVNIQRILRGYRARESYVDVLVAVTMQQATWRRFHAQKMYRETLSVKHTKAFVCQKEGDIGHVQILPIRHLSAKTIPFQAVVRGYLARREASRRTLAIHILQAWARVWLVRIRERKSRIRAEFREKVALSPMADKDFCAIKIQCVARGYIGWRQAQTRKLAVTTLQSRYRRHIGWRQAQSRKLVVAKLQSWFRKLLAKHSQCASRIQSSWRAHKQIVDYRQTIEGIVLSQGLFRRCLVIQTMKRWQESSLTIQKIARGFCVRSKRAHFLATKWSQYAESRSATTIQTQWRSHHASAMYRNSKEKVVLIQSLVRCWCAVQKRRRERESYQAMKKVARVYLVRSELKRILSLNVWKFSTRIHFEAKKEEWEAFPDSSLAFQKVWRGILSAAVFLQTSHRRFVAQKAFRRVLKAGLTIQGCARVWVDERHRHATVIQTQIRSFLCSRSYRRKRNALVLIRRSAQRWVLLFENKRRHDASCLIQAIVRRKLVRAKMKRTLAFKKRKTRALLMYALFQCYKKEMKRTAAITIQVQYRQFLCESKYRAALVAAPIAQTYYRRYAARTRYLKLLRAIRFVQAQARRRVCEHVYNKTLSSIVVIQKCTRRYVQERIASICIQKIWRGYQAEVLYMDVRVATIILQASLRRFAAQTVYRIVLDLRATERRERENVAAIAMQKTFRRYQKQKQYKKTRERSAAFSIKARVQQINNLGLKGALAAAQASPYTYSGLQRARSSALDIQPGLEQSASPMRRAAAQQVHLRALNVAPNASQQSCKPVGHCSESPRAPSLLMVSRYYLKQEKQ